jgi:hypothetical protein
MGGLKQLSAMRLSREELLMKLGAARQKTPTAWRLIMLEMSPNSAMFSYRLDRNRLRVAAANSRIEVVYPWWPAVLQLPSVTGDFPALSGAESRPEVRLERSPIMLQHFLRQTRTRRSSERGFDMPRRPPPPASSLNQLRTDLGTPLDSFSSANALKPEMLTRQRSTKSMVETDGATTDAQIHDCRTILIACSTISEPKPPPGIDGAHPPWEGQSTDEIKNAQTSRLDGLYPRKNFIVTAKALLARLMKELCALYPLLVP